MSAPIIGGGFLARKAVMFFALTGGIAAGKSTFSAQFTELGVNVISADFLAREAVLPGSEANKKIQQRWGDEVILRDGTLNRSAMADIIFNDPYEKKQLEKIIHPEVQKLAHNKMSAFLLHNRNASICYEIPLLTNNSNKYNFDFVISIEVSEQEQSRRLQKYRKYSVLEANNRIKQQGSASDRQKASDLIFHNELPYEQTLELARILGEVIIENGTETVNKLLEYENLLDAHPAQLPTKIKYLLEFLTINNRTKLL